MKIKKIVLLIAFLLAVVNSFAQLRIDWQQCYGGLGFDEPAGFLPKNEGYIILGSSDLGSGMIVCGDQGSTGSWVIEIDEDHEIVNQDCSQGYHGILKANDMGYYIYGKKVFPSTGNSGILVIRTDDDLNIIWERILGCEEHFFPYAVHGVITDDGGIVCTTDKGEWACGDVSLYFGGLDIWVVKLDENGELEWETTLGTNGDEMDNRVAIANDGGLYVLGDADNQSWNGSIENCTRPGGYSDGIFVKMNANGEVEWNRCYGGNNHDVVSRFMELPDGYLLGGSSSSSDGDLQGAGYHLGHWYGQPYMPLTSDIWLLRTDLDGNVLWSKCYGGTKHERFVGFFQNEDGGFTVFGTTMSLDGDSQSANNLKPAWNLEIGNKLWVFRTDSNGNLLWERAIGTQTESDEYLEDVIKHNDREYTILGQADSSGGEMPCGDYNCSNDTAYLMNSYSNYWVLHITDTVDYSTIGIHEWHEQPTQTIQVYPNPSSNTIIIEMPPESMVSEFRIYNAQGQLVKVEHGTNVIDVAGLPKGIYLLLITDKNKKNYVKRIPMIQQK